MHNASGSHRRIICTYATRSVCLLLSTLPSSADNVGIDCESILSGECDDTITGGGGEDVIDGNGGTDVIDCGTGDSDICLDAADCGAALSCEIAY